MSRSCSSGSVTTQIVVWALCLDHLATADPHAARGVVPRDERTPATARRQRVEVLTLYRDEVTITLVTDRVEGRPRRRGSGL